MNKHQLILILLLSSNVLWAAGKIGYVDMNILISESPQILQANQNLTAEFEAENQKISQQESDLSSLEKRITQEGPLMTTDELLKLQERARILERQVRRAKEDLKDAITIRNSQMVDEVQAELKKVVTEYAENNGFDAILINAILYVNDEVDITDEILAQLRQSHNQ
ncbi:OmpH family outer membrane protein [Marinicella rhabdoformis]|uniref:OmpH family outer membrane protein n=1 Tax=Marinicella rhabdoformis TaxID=2580566 RepID=UPI0012AECF3E|nr:OmpH family outer membrane protein [Marinicella rhabdoformis]